MSTLAKKPHLINIRQETGAEVGMIYCIVYAEIRQFRLGTKNKLYLNMSDSTTLYPVPNLHVINTSYLKSNLPVFAYF